MRTIPEWFGETDDAKIPDRVRLRVFERYGGKCAITGKRLMPGEWDCDHIKPLRDGGIHCESNLQPVWRKKHREKTADENRERARLERKHRKHLLPKQQGKIPSRKFNQSFKPNTKDIWAL